MFRLDPLKDAGWFFEFMNLLRSPQLQSSRVIGPVKPSGFSRIYGISLPLPIWYNLAYNIALPLCVINFISLDNSKGSVGSSKAKHLVHFWFAHFFKHWK